MFWVRSSRIEIYLGASLIGLRRPEAVAEWWSVEGLDAGLQRLDDYLRDAKAWRSQLRVWIGAASARPFIVPPNSGAQDRAEALLIARNMAGEATGLMGAKDVWLDDWRADQPCSAVALAPGWLDALLAVGTAHRVRLASVRPWWCLACTAVQALSRKSAVPVQWSVAEPEGLVYGSALRGKMLELDSCNVLPHDPQWRHMRVRAMVSAEDGAAGWHADARLGAAANASDQSVPLPIGSWVALKAVL